MRISIQSAADIKIKPSIIWKVLKDLIGKNLLRFEMPIFVYEPMSIIQKSGEIAFYFSMQLAKAAQEKDSQKRMVLVAAAICSALSQVPGRVNMPFNALLGETYELVTPCFRILSEMVSAHPPVAAVHAQGDNWEFTRAA